MSDKATHLVISPGTFRWGAILDRARLSPADRSNEPGFRNE